jgi:hypothetical protein
MNRITGKILGIVVFFIVPIYLNGGKAYSKECENQENFILQDILKRMTFQTG